MIGAWSAAAPYDGTPDEQAHILRAAGVAEGQFIVKPGKVGGIQRVPQGLIRKNCWRFNSTKSAACARPPSSDSTLVDTLSTAGRYNPGYYAMVGLPLRLWPGWPGVLLARLIGAAVCAALLASAFVSALRWSRLRLMAVGLVVATTPMTLQMASAVNPNGLEIAAAVALFAGGIALFLRPVGSSVDRRLIWQVGISAGVLATLRAAGPLWLAVAVVALLWPLWPSRIRTLLRDRAMRWCVGTVGLILLLGVGWTVTQKATDLGNFRLPFHLSPARATWGVVQQWGEYTNELVGVMSWLDVRLPEFVYLLWEFIAASLVIWAVVYGRRTDRWRLLVIFAGGVLVPTMMQVKYINTTGIITQGRYMLPVLVGLVLLATFVIEERGLDPARARTLGRLIVIVILPLHLVALAYTMARWQSGIVVPFPPVHPLNPLAGTWHPVLGSAAPLIAEVVGLLLIGVMTWAVVGRPVAVDAADVSTAVPAVDAVEEDRTTPVGAGPTSWSAEDARHSGGLV